MNTIRGYKTFPICKNTLAPIIFLGLPLKLSIIYISSFVVSIMLAFILGSFGVSNPYLRVIIAFVFGVISMGGITLFYKNFGIKGFHFYRRNKNIDNEIIADKSIIRILKSKIQ